MTQTNIAERCQKARERVESLTPRERDVLHCIVDGEPSKVIARKLGISPRTVENHRISLLARLNVGSSTAAASIGACAGFGECGYLEASGTAAL